MLKKLIKLANNLDFRGLTKEADLLDQIIRKMAGTWDNLSVSYQDFFKENLNTVEEINSFDSQKLGELHEILLSKGIVEDNADSFVSYLLDNKYLTEDDFLSPTAKADAFNKKINEYLASGRAKELRNPCQPLTEDQKNCLLILNSISFGQFALLNIPDQLKTRISKHDPSNPVCYNKDLEPQFQEVANYGFDKLVSEAREAYELEKTNLRSSVNQKFRAGLISTEDFGKVESEELTNLQKRIDKFENQFDLLTTV